MINKTTLEIATRQIVYIIGTIDSGFQTYYLF